MRLPAIILAGAFVVAAAEAHVLRAPYDQCVALLGEPIPIDATPVSPATQARVFESEDWTAVIQFWRGRAHAVSVAKKNGDAIAESEITNLLEEFGDGKTWSKDEKGTYWRRDGQLLAMPGKHDDFIVLSAEFAINVQHLPW